MRLKNRAGRLLALLAIALVAMPSFAVALAQQPASSERKKKASNENKEEDVIRVSTDLVQTGVSVSDKKGKLVTNLQREDFELKVDNQLQEISFLEFVTTGTSSDMQSVTSVTPANGTQPTTEQPLVNRGRTVLFLIDDFHLAVQNVSRTRAMLFKFIDEMGANDQALIASTSGQIGFLQQLTGNKTSLRAAVNRLKFRPSTLFDNEAPTMSIEQAFAVERNDRDVIQHFVAFLTSTVFFGLAKTNAALAASAAEQMVRSRARRIVVQADSITTATLSTIENFARSSSYLPGRKLGIFVSDGFQYDPTNTITQDRIQRISDAALRAGLVIYSVGAAGLSTSFPDAASDERFIAGADTGRVLGGDVARQEPLVSVAAVTGGRALLNMNDPLRGIRQAMQETAQYYLLAWRPDPSLLKSRKFHHVEVKLKGHPELIASVQRGYFTDDITQANIAYSKALAEPGGFPLQELLAAIRDAYSRTPLSTNLIVSYFDEANKGQMLSILMQVPIEDISATSAMADQKQFLDIAGAVFRENGKLAGTFLERLPVMQRTDESRHTVLYFNQYAIKPGLYQVRVAARDAGGRIGKATQWIEVPSSVPGHLTLSSLVIGETPLQGPSVRSNEMPERAQLKIDNRFEQRSKLRLFFYLYNPTWPSGPSALPDLDVETQILRDDEHLISKYSHQPTVTGLTDQKRIAYAEDLSLAALRPGHYLIRVIATDRLAKTTAAQEVRFEIE